MSSDTDVISPGPARRHRHLSAVVVIATVLVFTSSPAYAAAPTPGQQQPPGTQGLTTMLSWGGWLVSFVCVAGLLVVAGMMALKHRRGEGGGAASGRSRTDVAQRAAGRHQ